ncbi:hypothetical protein NMY22_g15183 [Coprinellus aureogranulatus]|nr:hypothetical protein NMY22_g15183 [Coprinellus aureogranulatus]
MPPRKGKPGELNIVTLVPKGTPILSATSSGASTPSSTAQERHPNWNLRFAGEKASSVSSAASRGSDPIPGRSAHSAPPNSAKFVTRVPPNAANISGCGVPSPAAIEVSCDTSSTFGDPDTAMESVAMSISAASVYVPILSLGAWVLTDDDSAPTSTASTSLSKPVCAADKRILELLRNLRKECRVGAVGLITRIFDKTNTSFSSFRTEYFKESWDSLSLLLDTLVDSDQGRQNLSQWLQSPKGTSVVPDIVSDGMDAVCRFEKLDGLMDITPEFIERWDVCGHEERAPFTISVLTVAAQTERAKKENKIKHPHALAYQRSGNSLGFPAIFGLFLWAHGALRQVIDAAHRCCLSIDYSSIQTLIRNLGDEGIKLAIAAARALHANGDDNMNLSTSIFVEQRGLSTPAKVTSGTWGILYPLPNASPEHMKLAPITARFLALGPEALTFQRDIRPTAERLDRVNKVFVSQIVQVLLRHTPGFEGYRKRAGLMPTPRRLTAQKARSTIQLPLRVTTIEEASTNGNSLFHDEAYINQLKADPGKLSEYAIPTYNDQLTNSRIRSVKLERAADINPWEKRDTFQPYMGLFHLCINFSLALLQLHRGALDETGSFTYLFRILGKTRLKPDYHTPSTAMYQIFDGNIYSIWERLCTGRKVNNTFASPSDLADGATAEANPGETAPPPILTPNDYAATAPTSEELLAKVTEILKDYATPLPPTPLDELRNVKVDIGDDGETIRTTGAAKRKYLPMAMFQHARPDPAEDVANQNLRITLRDLLVFTELMSAIAAGDIGAPFRWAATLLLLFILP